MKRNIQFAIAGLLTMAAFSLSSCQQDEALVSSVNGTGLSSEKASIRNASEEVVCSIKTDSVGQVAEKIEAFLKEENLTGGMKVIDRYNIEGPINDTDILYIRGDHYYYYIDCLDLTNAILYADEGYQRKSYVGYGWKDYYGASLGILYLPKSISSIGEKAFCDNYVSEIYVPDNVTEFGEGAFCRVYGLHTVHMPEQLTKLPNDCFSESESLKNVELPSSITEIGENAFNGTALVNIEIPSSVESIGDYAFRNTKLESIGLPNSISKLGVGVFQSCESLKTVSQWPENVHQIPDELFSGCTQLQFDIPPYITSIGSSAFKSCEAIISVSLPEGVTHIGDLAFYSTGLTSIKLPEGISELGNEVFGQCGKLTTVEWPKDIHEIPYQMFFSCSKLLFEIPSHITSIEEMAFCGCEAFTNINIPEGVTYIGSTAFGSTNIMGGVTIPSSLNSSGVNLFDGCKRLSYIIWNSTQAAVPYLNNSGNLLVYLPNGGEVESSNSDLNVVIKGRAGTIRLVGDTPFTCPEEFTADRVEIVQDYSSYPWYEVYTGTGKASRWRSIALPFTVTSIKSAGKGKLAPFHSEEQENGSAKPFWLCEMTESGFQSATQIEANKPYLLAMPNNSAYFDEYNINDQVTFSAQNVKIGKTPETMDSSPNGPDGWALTPTFVPYTNRADIFSLNESEFEKNGSYYPVGNCFRANERDIRAFEAVVYLYGASRSILPLGQNLSRSAARPLGRVPQPEDMPLP